MCSVFIQEGTPTNGMYIKLPQLLSKEAAPHHGEQKMQESLAPKSECGTGLAGAQLQKICAKEQGVCWVLNSALEVVFEIVQVGSSFRLQLLLQYTLKSGMLDSQKSVRYGFSETCCYFTSKTPLPFISCDFLSASFSGIQSSII